MSHEIQPDPSNHPHEHESEALSNPVPSNRPLRDLMDDREKYFEIGLPLYQASIKCDWKAAESILDNDVDRKFLKCIITENGETALHIAASAKAPKKKVDEFVKNLVERMENEDLQLVNDNKSTALYLAAAAGNIETVKIMMEKNRELMEKNREPMEKNQEWMEKNRESMEKNRESMETNRELTETNQYLMETNRYLMEKNRYLMETNRYLDTIPGGEESVLPLYAAVKFGNKDVAEHLYERSEDLTKDGCWTIEGRFWFLEMCVESDIFDIALKVVEKYPELGTRKNSNILRYLAGKPEAFHEKKSSNTESNFIRRTIKLVSAFIVYKAGNPVKKSDALSLLRILWEDIVKLPKKDMNDILRGPPDSIKSGLGRIAQNIQLKQRFFSHLDKLDVETRMIMNVDGTEKVSKLHDLVDTYVVNMHVETQSLIKQENTIDEYQALGLQKLISEFIVKLHHETKKMLANPDVNDEDQAPRLENLISNHIKKIRAETEIKMHAETEIRDTHTSRVMFIAAEVGNTNFLLELIRRRPDLIWQVDDNGLSIFHVAVKHRHEGIYNLLYEIGSMKDMVTPIKDKDGNNMLHLAAMRTRKKNLEDVSGAALQMQQELLWFKEVERMVPPYLRESKNKDGFTPRELFTIEHQHLIDQGETWMKETASQCMVVATLIATIVFAAAFTVPGGYNQNDGIPVFKRKLSFVAFVVADAISLFLSSASILTFLSILTSRYAERDFVASLPMKLMLGLVTLFLSIGTMMVTFSISFFVLYHKEMKWIPIFISLFAVIPAILYVALQFHLLVDVFRSTYGGKYLYKPKKQILFYYEKPKFPKI